MFSNKKTIVAALGTLVLVMGIAGALTAKPSKGLLDGQTYTVKVWVEGDTKTNPDNLSFKNGKFFSTDCEQWGFKSAAYKATKHPGHIDFEVKATSAKEGTVHWKGKVDNKGIKGSFLWTKKGQKDMTYLFEGKRK
jgi:hypothetical protein